MSLCWHNNILLILQKQYNRIEYNSSKVFLIGTKYVNLKLIHQVKN